jgi:very-short-patch-repair endonuclease
LKDAGFVVIRFWNNEVLTNMDGVLRHIMDLAGEARSTNRSL